MSNKHNSLYSLLNWFIHLVNINVVNSKESWGCGKERLALGANSSSLLIWAAPICLLLILLSGAEAWAGNGSIHPWGYEGGEGPDHWGETEQDHEKHLMCREGTSQSPVDIRDVPGLKLAPLGFHYMDTRVSIINNSHTIHVGYDSGSYANWGNIKFKLIQFHFHHPSEHTVMGKHFDMEIHMVHKTQDDQYVVIGILMKKGKHHAGIQKIWDRIPKVINEEVTYKDVRTNAAEFLPAVKKYYHYDGSLTTPPCSENVSWFVLEDHVEISEDQIHYFQSFIDHNARPVQKLNHRTLTKIP